MPEEQSEVRLPRFSRPIGLARSWGREVLPQPRGGMIGVLTPFTGLLDLRVKPGGEMFPVLSYLVLRPLLIRERSDTDSSRIARLGRNVSDGRGAGRIPNGEAGERITEPASSESAFSFLTLRSPVIKAVSAGSRGGEVLDRHGGIGTRVWGAPKGTRHGRGREGYRVLTSEVEGTPGRGSSRSGAAGGLAEKDLAASGGGGGEGFPGERTTSFDSAKSVFSFLTLQPLVVREVPSTAEGPTVEQDASVGTIDERFPRERTRGIDNGDRLRSGVTDWSPPLLGRREVASEEGLQTAEHSMTLVEKEDAGDRSATPGAEPSVTGSETHRPQTRRPGEKRSALREGRNRDSPSVGKPSTALRDSPTYLGGLETATMTLPRMLTTIGTMGERRSRLDSSTQEPRTEVLGEREVGEEGSRKGSHGVRSGVERGEDVSREAVFSGEDVSRRDVFSGEDLEMTFRRDRSGTTVSRDGANRVAEESERLDGVEPPRSGGREQGNREQRDDTPSAAAPSLEQVDIDRFVDRLYRGLERKMRIERERRGL